jgi:hypothetical protein
MAKYTVPEGHHAHCCSKCGLVWQHSDDMRGDENAHTCACGEMSWYQHRPDVGVYDRLVRLCKTPCYVGDDRPKDTRHEETPKPKRKRKSRKVLAYA